jgi:hypothetical protein
LNQLDNTLGLVSLKRTILHTVSVSPDVHSKESDADLLGKNWVIGLINLSNKCMTIAGTRRIGGGDAEWKWTQIPKTCKNCTTSYDQCFKEQRWSIIMSTDCSSAPFEMFIGYFISDTDVQGAIFDITPRCSSGGGIVGMTD